MSNTPVQEPPAGELSSGSDQTLPSRPFQPISDPSASKRVCFYKSGDYKFSGHRMVINARTFKTFDALLDALSKKVPLPFGVRTITTPRGIHMVKALDDLHDGGSYVCSDQKRVKPLNLDEVNRRQVPWNTTRPFSAGRRKRQRLQFGRRNEVTNRPAKVTERVAVRTPKRLVVIKNRDPTVKRTIVLQRRTAPTFDALLDYLSQILQFPVLKLFSTDGRRVDGLAALILCSGIVVAAGNEPFRLGNYRTGQMPQAMYMDTVEPSMLQPRAYNNKSISSGRGSRNFSLSSERYIVNQINKSRNGSLNGHIHRQSRSFETEVNRGNTPREMCGSGRVDREHHACIVPQDDDIEKSFRVNQDGSMTVEMKVHLTIKEEEMLHWTTTLSRSSLSKRTVCASISESGNSSPDSNNAFAKESSSVSEDETKEENHPAGAGKGVGFNGQRVYESYTPTLGKKGFKRAPTPGPRHVKKTASVESVKMVTESRVQESTLGHYSYMEKTADGETTEGYCVVKHSSSSNKPIPKPRKTASAGASKKGSHSSIRSSGVAEVLQIQNSGMEVTETVMHIYESQGCYDNYFANEEYSADSVPAHGSSQAPESQPSTASEPCSSSNDCDIDFSCHPRMTDSQQRQTEEMLSLSSEPLTPAHEMTNNLSLKTNKTPRSEKKQVIKPAKNQKSSTSTSSLDKKQKDSTVSPSKHSKHSSTDKLNSNVSVGKKSLSSSESVKSGRRSGGSEKTQLQREGKDGKTPRKEYALLASTENVKKTPPKRQNLNKAAAKDNGHNVITPTGRPQMKKNMLDILQPKKSLLPGKKTISKPKSMTENRIPSPKKSLELSESFSMPSLNPSPSEIHQYVENWLEKVSSDPVPYSEEAITDDSEPQTKVVFKIGADSESDEKSESQTNVDENYDAMKKSPSCLSVPLCHTEPATTLLHNEQYARGLCVSMPSVRVDPAHQENILRAHKSAEAIGPADTDQQPPSPSTSNILSPKEKIRPVLRQLCSSIQCIRGASNTTETSNLEKSSSLPDFPTQVASVFGSSCKAFLSFLSVMTLRDNLTGSALGDGSQSRCTSEAMLMMESLQKISAIEDEEELRASLTDLQSRASSQLRERWKDFQILRERLESEPLSPKISETEFALDVFSEGGDAFEDQHLGIDELMDELNMPQDLREQISSTIQQAKTFYPVEESTFVDTERNQSESEEDVEKFVEDGSDGTKQSPEPDSIDENIIQTKQDDGDNEQAEMMSESEQGRDEVQELERDETLAEKESENVQEPQLQEVEEDREGANDGENEDTKEIDDNDEVTVVGQTEREEVEVGDAAEEKMNDIGQEEWEEGKGSEEEEGSVEKVEERTEEEMTVDGEEEGEVSEEGEKEVDGEEGLVGGEDQEEKGNDSAEETEREGAEETEGEEKGEDEVDQEADEEEKEHGEEIEEAPEEVIEETDEGEEVENAVEEEGEEEEEEKDQRDAFTKDVEAEEEQGILSAEENIKEEEEEEVAGEKEEEEVESVTKEMREEEEEADAADVDEEAEEVTEENDEEEGVESITEEMKEEAEDEDEEEEKDGVTEEDVVDAIIQEEDKREESVEEGDDEDEVDIEEKDEEEDKNEVVSEENDEEDEEEEKQEQEEDERDAEDFEFENVDDRAITEEEEDEEEETDKDMENEEKCDEGHENRKELKKTEHSTEDESFEEGVEEEESEENMKAGQMLDDEEGEDDEENKSDKSNEGLDQVEEQESKDEGEDKNVSDEADSIDDVTACKNLLEEALYLQQSEEEDGEVAEHNTESPTKSSYEGQCEDDKGNGTDTVSELETHDGGQGQEDGSGALPHPVEISQELLDFVNSALQSSSLIFTYDAQGNVRIEPDTARVTHTTQTVIPKRRQDSSYGLKRLPSPSTSDLSDYRPDTSESGGYKTQESVDIVTESGEDASARTSPVRTHRTNVERVNSKLSVASNSEVVQNSRLKSGGSFSSYDSGKKASREDLSYFSGGSSQKADVEAAAEATQCISLASEKDSVDGVLIDHGRWLLKENHLIRKSPPVSLGMYGNADSTSDTGQENMSEDSPPHYKTQSNPLAAISSSELEEMAKPHTPKCTYFNMPHGSDSDPFLDDSSFKSGKNETSSVTGRGIRVSPTIDTSKTWANKNGSLSSFASVEFKIPDRKVHPEGESSGVVQARRTSSGGRGVLQAQESLETLHLRCGQYCPIL